LNYRPNPNYNAATFKYDTICDLLLKGEAIWIPYNNNLYKADSFYINNYSLDGNTYTGISSNKISIPGIFQSKELFIFKLNNGKITRLLNSFGPSYRDFVSKAFYKYISSGGEKYIYKIDIPKTKNLTFVEALKKIVYYAYPATLGALVTPITSFLDSFMIINILTNAGFSSLQATNLYGISNGIVNTLISLPVVICSAIATAIVPNLSGLFAKNNESEVSFKSSFFIKITWLIAIPCFLMFLIPKRKNNKQNRLLLYLSILPILSMRKRYIRNASHFGSYFSLYEFALF